MKKTSLLSVALLSLAAFASAATAAEKSKGEKPKSSPGWVIIEEDYFFPWRFEPIDWFHNTRMHYRRNEEKAAAGEVRKAISWLKYAAGHAMPETKKHLDEAVAELTTLAGKLEKGQVASARTLDSAFAKAEHALATWHYFKAKDSLAKDELKYAAQDLHTAATYLKNAANSARYEYGNGLVTVFDEIDDWGDVYVTGVSVDRNRLGNNLQAIERELTKLSDTLKKDAS